MAAIAAGNNVTLQSNVTLSESLEIPDDYNGVIDLNGKTLTTATTDDEYNGIVSNGNLTIKNGNISSTNNAILAKSGVLNLINCNVTTNCTVKANAVEINGKVTATITGGSYIATGTLPAEQDSDWYGIGIWDGTVTLNTNVSGFNGGVTLAPSAGQKPYVTIQGGSYSGTLWYGLNMHGGDLTLEDGCSFNGCDADIRVYTNTGTVNGKVINAGQNMTYTWDTLMAAVAAQK